LGGFDGFYSRSNRLFELFNYCMSQRGLILGFKLLNRLGIGKHILFFFLFNRLLVNINFLILKLFIGPLLLFCLFILAFAVR
jgi:hypothetical protein